MNAESDLLWSQCRNSHESAATDVHPGLDPLDAKLTDELQKDGRTSYAELARRLAITEKTVRRRVSRLLEQRSITIAAITDPASLGFRRMALALITTNGARSPIDLAAELIRLPEADYVTVTTGKFTMQVELIGVDAAELHDVVDNKIRPLPGIESVELLPYLHLHYQQVRLSAPWGNSDGVRPRPLDDTDRAIVAHLAADGRIPLRDIATAVGVSEATVRFRYGKLVDSGAVRVTCIANPLQLGYHFSGWLMIRVGEQGSAKNVAELLTRLDSVSYVAITAGRYDVVAEVMAHSGAELSTILDDHIRSIDGVGGLQFWIYTAVYFKAVHPRNIDPKTVKENHMPVVRASD